MASAAVLATAAFLAVEIYRGRFRIGFGEAERYAVWGIDVSHHQPNIDWARVAAQPRIRFAYVKATEGGDWIDPDFVANWAHARASGLRVGAYHFFSFCRPPLDQVKNFLAALSPDKDTLPPAVDVELGGNCNRTSDRAGVRRDLGIFVREVAQRTGRRPILYATGEAYELFVRDAGLANPIWIRSIFIRPSLDESRWQLWQFADDARVDGIASSVDLNAFPGELADLLAL